MTPAHMRVALKLAGLAEVDREWLLERLDDDSRDSVGKILTRLLHAGLHLSVTDDRANVAAEPYRDQGADHRTVRKAKSEIIATLLMREPNWVSNLIFRIDNWPWVDAVIAEFPDARRATLVSSLRQDHAEVARGLKDTLIELLAEMITDELDRRTSASRFERILARAESDSTASTA